VLSPLRAQDPCPTPTPWGCVPLACWTPSGHLAQPGVAVGAVGTMDWVSTTRRLPPASLPLPPAAGSVCSLRSSPPLCLRDSHKSPVKYIQCKYIKSLCLLLMYS
jgi:hypothetical protein